MKKGLRLMTAETMSTLFDKVQLEIMENEMTQDLIHYMGVYKETTEQQKALGKESDMLSNTNALLAEIKMIIEKREQVMKALKQVEKELISLNYYCDNPFELAVVEHHGE